MQISVESRLAITSLGELYVDHVRGDLKMKHHVLVLSFFTSMVCAKFRLVKYLQCTSYIRKFAFSLPYKCGSHVKSGPVLPFVLQFF